MSVKIEKDFSGLKQLKASLREITGTDVEWGFFEEDSYGPDNDNLPVAAVASFNEFGTDFNPERPFFRTSIDDAKKELPSIGLMVFKKILKGASVESALKPIGNMLKEMLQDSIESWTTPPNSIRWFNFKASVGAPTKPLQFTQTMLDSVKFKLCRRRK